MDLPMSSPPRSRRRGAGIAGVALIALLATQPALAAGSGPGAPDVAVKAALLFNFGKFVQWPALAAKAPLVICVVGDGQIATAVSQTVRGQNINGHELQVRQPEESTTWRTCHLLFIAAAETRRSAAGLGGIRTAPILTVSDGQGFADTGGIIELFVDDGKIRFAINVDATARAGLQLSSRLLLLARVIRDGQAHHESLAASWTARSTPTPIPGVALPAARRVNDATVVELDDVDPGLAWLTRRTPNESQRLGKPPAELWPGPAPRV
jgi:YfiR/HmsC-like